MFQRIVVPLDGSTRAEYALPIAARIARTNGGSLLIIKVMMNVPEMGWSTTELEEEARSKERHYLEKIAQLKDLADIKITTQVRIGNPTEQILTAVHAHHADLIVMSSRGRTELKRWVMGSVVQAVIDQSPIPVFVLQCKDNHQPLQQQEQYPIRIMIILDGSPRAESVLTPAAYLSAALSAPAPGALHLTRAIHRPLIFENGHNDRVAKMIQQETSVAQAYLQTIEQRLREGELAKLNLNIASIVVHGSDIVMRLLKIAELGEKQDGINRCDVIALATQEKSGMQYWIVGSVVERLLSISRLPLFVVQAQKNQ